MSAQGFFLVASSRLYHISDLLYFPSLLGSSWYSAVVTALCVPLGLSNGPVLQGTLCEGLSLSNTTPSLGMGFSWRDWCTDGMSVKASKEGKDLKRP